MQRVYFNRRLIDIDQLIYLSSWITIRQVTAVEEGKRTNPSIDFWEGSINVILPVLR